MAAELGVPLERYYYVDQRVSEAVVMSVEDPTMAEAAEQTLLPTLEGLSPWLDPALLVESKDLIDKVAAAIAQVSYREQVILTLYYYEELTMQEIGEVLGLTLARISQILSKVTAGLRRTLLAEASPSTAPQPGLHGLKRRKWTCAAGEDSGR